MFFFLFCFFCRYTLVPTVVVVVGGGVAKVLKHFDFAFDVVDGVVAAGAVADVDCVLYRKYRLSEMTFRCRVFVHLSTDLFFILQII